MIGILNKILTAGPMTNPSYLRNLAETVVEQEKSIVNYLIFTIVFYLNVKSFLYLF